MTTSRITARLEYDVKHLIWRAQVHRLSSEEVSRRFEQIKREYLLISTPQEQGRVLEELDRWQVVLAESGCLRREQAASPVLG